MNILLTGGLGYIGSHIATKAIDEGHRVIILDNLSNSCLDVLSNLNKLTNQKNTFYDSDIRDGVALKRIFKKNNIDIIIHCAGLKSVYESFSQKKLYQENNVEGSRVLFDIATEFGIEKIIFSSSAAVYGQPNKNPIQENDLLKPECPYGQNKMDIEQILTDICESKENLSCVSLRYFNPIGAHKSGLIGENSLNRATNIFPLICNSALGYEVFEVYGNDYDTPDGTCVRDFIHIDDLVSGHLAAMSFTNTFKGCKAVNLGTGKGISVLELLTIFNNQIKSELNFSFGERREGDAAEVFADPSLANKIFGWRAKKSVVEMINDGWQWERLKKTRIKKG